jgi:nanoRNase/pAp phosphatase (c-di-AMP/oligoRNAs hydrolase)
MMMQERLDRLFEAVGSAGSVLILPHNDPDPDAIASALALRHLLAEKAGVEGHIAYKGIIGRAENKALVRYLGCPLRRLVDSDLRQPVPIALIDTQPGAGNNALPPKSSAAIVIDHHPWLEATASADFADVRSDVGAISTILTEYLQVAGIEPTLPLATALFYGIKTDTLGLSRGASPADVAAYLYLQSRIDVKALGEIEQAQVPAEYFQKLDATLHATRVYDDVVISYVGSMGHPDLAAEMADILLRLKGTRWVVCIGMYGDHLILAVRTRNRRGGAERLVQAIVGNKGTAGGHGTMAGGRVPLQGKDPEHTVLQLSQRALQYLKAPPEMAGVPLI